MKLFRLFLLVMVGALFLIWSYWPDGKLRVVFCDVGQGDAAIVIKGSMQIVIDTGSRMEVFDRCYKEFVPFWDRRIEAIYISHRHSDHNGAYEEIIRRYQVVNDMQDTRFGDRFAYGNLHIDTLKGGESKNEVNEKSDEGENENSVVLLLGYGEESVLFTGDMGEKEELALLDRGVLTDIEVLKVAHHGSKYSSGEEFLNRVKPELAVVSVGSSNIYGHPSSDTLSRLDILGAKVVRTDESGSVELVFEDNGIRVKTKKPR